SSGSGTYAAANAASGIQFFIPGSAMPTITGSAAGTGYASGAATTSTSGGWGGSGPARGAAGGGTITESGNRHIGVGGTENDGLTAGTVAAGTGSDSGTVTGSTSCSYSG